MDEETVVPSDKRENLFDADRVIAELRRDIAELSVELFDEKGHTERLAERLAEVGRERDEAVENYEGAVVELLARAEQAERERDTLERTLTKIWPVCEAAQKAVHDTNGGVGSMFAIANRLEKEDHRQAQRAKRAAADVHKGTEHLTALVFEVRKRVRQLGLAVGRRIMGDEPARGDGGGTGTPEPPSRFKVGDVIRYASGPTAFMQVTLVSRVAGRWRYYGREYFGISVGAYEHDCRELTADERARFGAGRGTPESAPRCPGCRHPDDLTGGYPFRCLACGGWRSAPPPKSGREFLGAARGIADAFTVEEFQELVDSIERSAPPSDEGSETR